MSATNRGSKRRESDYYPTPPWVVRVFLRYLIAHGRLTPQEMAGWWIDPCAGDGAIIRAARSVDGMGDSTWIAGELRGECRPLIEASGADMLYIRDTLVNPVPTWDGIITLMNPPFSLGLEFVRQAIERTSRVFSLQRVNWACTVKRYEFFKAHPPDVYLLAQRPSFNGDGKSDATAYCWYEWPGSGEDHGEVHWLPPVTKEEKDRE